MNASWQDIVAIGLIAVAAMYMIRRFWHTLSGKQKPRCGSCTDCSPPKQSVPTQCEEMREDGR